MSVRFTCDYCSERIPEEGPVTTVLHFDPLNPNNDSRLLGDYHEECFEKAWRAFELAEELRMDR